jgi:hypothetical protein
MRQVAAITPNTPSTLASDGSTLAVILDHVSFPCLSIYEATCFPMGVTPEMYDWRLDERVVHVVNWVAIWVLCGAPMPSAEVFPGPAFEGVPHIVDGAVSRGRLCWETKLLAMAMMWPQRRTNYWQRPVEDATYTDLEMSTVVGSVAAVAGIDGWIKQWWGAVDGDEQRRLRQQAYVEYCSALEQAGRSHTSWVLYPDL